MMKPLNRRTLLRGATTAIALPFLEAMLPSSPIARAGVPTKAPLRTAFLAVPNGVHMPKWKPSEVGRRFELPETLQPLASVKNKLCVLSGLTLDGARAHGDGPGDHARSGAAFLTGAHPKKTNGADIYNGVSIDQAIAQSLGGKTRFASLELGLDGSAQSGECDNGYSCAYISNLAWRSPTSPMACEVNPANVFDRLFAAPEKETATSFAVKSRRKSVLDFALGDAQRLQARLGAADRRKVDEYLYAIRDIENRLVRSEKLELGENGLPNYERPAGVPREIDEHARLMMDMMVLALQSDATRVTTLMLAREGSNRTHPNLGISEAHHQLSHHGKSEEKQAKIAKIDHFYVQQFAYLLQSLESIREGDDTLLDNCMVMYGSGISDGDRHNHDDLPILLAGGGGGRLQGGRHLQYAKNTPLCDLYLWMLNRSGVAADSFGDSSGPLKL